MSTIIFRKISFSYIQVKRLLDSTDFIRNEPQSNADIIVIRTKNIHTARNAYAIPNSVPPSLFIPFTIGIPVAILDRAIPILKNNIITKKVST